MTLHTTRPLRNWRHGCIFKGELSTAPRQETVNHLQNCRRVANLFVSTDESYANCKTNQRVHKIRRQHARRSPYPTVFR